MWNTLIDAYKIHINIQKYLRKNTQIKLHKRIKMIKKMAKRVNKELFHQWLKYLKNIFISIIISYSLQGL